MPGRLLPLCWCGIVATFLFAHRGAAQTTFSLPDTAALSTQERELLRFEQARSAAIAGHDTTRLRQMYADEFRGITAAGLPVNRERLLQVFMGDESAFVFTMDDITVRAPGKSGDVAFFSGRLTTRRRGGGVVGIARLLHIYIRRDGRWQILAGQGTMVSAPPGGNP